MTLDEMVAILNISDEFIYLCLNPSPEFDKTLAVEADNRVAPSVPTELRAIFVNGSVNQSAILYTNDIATVSGAAARGAMPRFFDSNPVAGLREPKFGVVVSKSLQSLQHVELVGDACVIAIRIPPLIQAGIHHHFGAMHQHESVDIVAQINAAGAIPKRAAIRHRLAVIEDNFVGHHSEHIDVHLIIVWTDAGKARAKDAGIAPLGYTLGIIVRTPHDTVDAIFELLGGCLFLVVSTDGGNTDPRLALGENSRAYRVDHIARHVQGELGPADPGCAFDIVVNREATTRRGKASGIHAPIKEQVPLSVLIAYNVVDNNVKLLMRLWVFLIARIVGANPPKFFGFSDGHESTLAHTRWGRAYGRTVQQINPRFQVWPGCPPAHFPRVRHAAPRAYPRRQPSSRALRLDSAPSAPGRA